MKFGFLSSVLVLLSLGLTSCGTSNSTTSSGTGILYVATQGNASVSAFAIALSSGALSTNGNAVASGNKASSLVITPAGDAIFVANSQDNTISGYTVNSDGTLKSSGTATALKAPALTPTGLAMDPGGKFLYVANQGTFDLTLAGSVPGSVSVFSVKGGALTEIAGSPFLTEGPTDLIGTGPASVTVSANGNYLYVANRFTNTVTGFTISSGALTVVPGSPYAVGTSPSAAQLTPDGNFLYVGNTGSNTVSAFSACTSAGLTCTTPDGHLHQVPGSPFPAGLGPVAIAVAKDPLGEYLFVVDHASNEVSQYKVGSSNGVLTPLTPIALSTGSGPEGIAIRAGGGTALTDGGTTNYVYVTNATAGTISVYSYDTTTGVLTVMGSPVTTQGQPTGVGVK